MQEAGLLLAGVLAIAAAGLLLEWIIPAIFWWAGYGLGFVVIKFACAGQVAILDNPRLATGNREFWWIR